MAAAFSRRQEIKREAEIMMLDFPEFEITSRWLNESLTDESAKDTDKADRAWKDLEDINEADVLIRFTDVEDKDHYLVSRSLISGSRMFEMGYAYAHHKMIIVIGGHQCVFDWMASVHHFQTLNEAAMWLSNRKVMV